MEFDTESLKPLYRLTIGQAGQSYAFAIALKLGIPPHIIERSKEIALKPIKAAFPFSAAATARFTTEVTAAAWALRSSR